MAGGQDPLQSLTVHIRELPSRNGGYKSTSKGSEMLLKWIIQIILRKLPSKRTADNKIRNLCETYKPFFGQLGCEGLGFPTAAAGSAIRLLYPSGKQAESGRFLIFNEGKGK